MARGYKPFSSIDKKKLRAHGRVTISILVRSGTIKPPLRLTASYREERLEALLSADGTIHFDRGSYQTLSGAAVAAKQSICGSAPERRTDGWLFWRYRDPRTKEEKRINELRLRYLRSQKEPPADVREG